LTENYSEEYTCKMNNMERKKVVMIGGGTGTYSVLSGLKKFDNLDLSAVVAVTDSGGSTGKLRDEFGYLPVGDIRQCMVALAEEGNGQNLMRDLFNYRFDKGGEGLEGHSFGNLFITAMTEIMSGDEEKAIDYARRILRIKGEVIPVSLDHIDIVMEQEDGNKVFGETNIKDNYSDRNIESKIKKVWLEPEAHATPKAIKAIMEADLIIIGPGGLFTSLIANLLIKGIPDALQKTEAKILFNVNLMTDAGQTHEMTAREHVETIKNYIGKYPDYVLINNKELPEEIVKKYIESEDYPVKDDLEENSDFEVVREDLISGSDEVEKKKDFGAKRSLIRHNSKSISNAIYNNILAKL
jgi:uncharacterized cofD-like protein